MDKARRFLPLVAGILAVPAAWGAAAVGCDNGGSTTAAPDSGETDGTTSPDVTMSETGTEAAPHADASDAGDTGTKKDAGPDGDAAMVVDSSRAFEGGGVAFVGAIAYEFCSIVANCCGTVPDAATFNLASCLGQITPRGLAGSSFGTDLLGNGNVTFDPVSAQACLDTLSQLDCATNQIPSATEVAAVKSCFGAYIGKLPPNAPCNGHIECQPGNFCLPVAGGVPDAGDAGAIGICQPLVGDGGACGILGDAEVYPTETVAAASEAVCSYRGQGNSGLYCQYFDPSTVATIPDAAAWTCGPQEALMAGCKENADCVSLACHSSKCDTSLVIAPANTCISLHIDAGAPSDASAD
jgi:hypothetical protein